VAISDNYFELFHLAETFQLDLNELAARYRELQRQTHPDRFAQGTATEKLTAVRYAANINEGFETLRHAHTRAEYLLSLHGIGVGGESSVDVDPEFLMQQMELRERLHSIEATDEVEQEIGQFKIDLAHQMYHLEEEFAQRFESGSISDLHSAAETLVKMQFIAKLQYQTIERENDFLDCH